MTQNATALQGLTILAIEDEPITQRLLLDILEYAGATVSLVTTGQEALAILEQQKFDILLVNIVLPDVSGYMFLEQWRQREREQSLVLTPAIALTAAVTETNKSRAVTAGFQDFVDKPFDYTHLLTKVLAAIAATGEGS